MKKMFSAVMSAIVLTGVFSGCKTTEANYSAAYEIAKQKRDEGLTEEELKGIRREQAMPKTVFNGDSIPLKGMYVKHVEGGNAKLYTVVVASFKQLFNARSVMKRLQDADWSDAVMLQDPREQRYYVGAFSTASLDSAVTVMRTLEGNPPVGMADGFPFILRK